MKIKSGMKAGNNAQKCKNLYWNIKQAKKNNQKAQMIKLVKSFKAMGCKVA